MTVIKTAARPVAERKPMLAFRRRRRSIALFTAPFVILFVVVYVAPIAYSVYQSLFKTEAANSLGYGGETKSVFVGLQNYLNVIHGGTFWRSLGHVALFGVVQVPIMLLIAAALALMLDSLAARGTRFFRIVYFLPYAIPGVIAAIMWSYLYQPTLSPIVMLLEHLGAGPGVFLGQNAVLWSMANITTWNWTGYNMLIILAALQSIPQDMYSAARLDGASELTLALRIKLPQVSNALVLTGTMSIIGTIQLFNEPEVLRQISNNVDSSYVPTMMALTEAFRNSDYSIAAAVSVLIAVIAGALSAAYYHLTSRYGR